MLYRINKRNLPQLIKQFGEPKTLSANEIDEIVSGYTFRIKENSMKLNLPPYDRATTRAALRIGLIRNRDNQANIDAINQALNDEDTCAVIGNWAQDTLAQNNANQGKEAVAAGNWLAVFQLLLQNLPSIIAMIVQLFQPKPQPQPQPQPQPTQPASGGK